MELGDRNPRGVVGAVAALVTPRLPNYASLVPDADLKAGPRRLRAWRIRRWRLPRNVIR